jgi:hypothetical protein
MFLALGMVALAMMLGSGAMSLGSIVVMFRSLVVFISSHNKPRWLLSLPVDHQGRYIEVVPKLGQFSLARSSA